MRHDLISTATLKQFIQFGFVGVTNTAISFVTYTILVYFGLHPQIGTIAGFVLSVTNAWLMNRFIVFKKEVNPTAKSTPVKFFSAYGLTLLLSMGLTFIFYNVFGINKYIVPVLNLLVTVPANFLLNKLWVFRK